MVSINETNLFLIFIAFEYFFMNAYLMFIMIMFREVNAENFVEFLIIY